MSAEFDDDTVEESGGDTLNEGQAAGGSCVCGVMFSSVDKSPDEYVNIGRNHFGICHACGHWWWVGSNLVSSWKDETEADWQKSRALLDEID